MWKNLIKLILLSSVVHATIEHTTPMRRDLWKISSSRMMCVITQEFDLWGDFSIIKKAGQPTEIALSTIQSLPYDAYYVGSKATWSDKFHRNNIKLNHFRYGGWRSDDYIGYEVITSLAEGRSVYFDLYFRNRLYDKLIIKPYYFDEQYSIFNECTRNLFPFDKVGMSNSVVYFESDSYQITPLAQEWLSTLLEYIEVQTEFQSIELFGYSDSSGSEPYNYKLSDLRVEKVKEYLMQNGIDESRIAVVAYGERSPMANNKTTHGRSLNRRVEIKIHHG